MTKCIQCHKKYIAYDGDAGTWREHFCSEDCRERYDKELNTLIQSPQQGVRADRLAKAILKKHLDNPDLRVTIFFVTKTQRRGDAYAWLTRNGYLFHNSDHPDNAYPTCVFETTSKALQETI